jgi:hypothetical protein
MPIAVAALLAIGVAEASAQVLPDADSDLVQDNFDNCDTIANGPNQASNQTDSDLDGYGNRCDPDLSNDGVVDGDDLQKLADLYGDTAGGIGDLDGDSVVGLPDILIWRAFLGLPPGPSGLSCAGTIPCAP